MLQKFERKQPFSFILHHRFRVGFRFHIPFFGNNLFYGVWTLGEILFGLCLIGGLLTIFLVSKKDADPLGNDPRSQVGSFNYRPYIRALGDEAFVALAIMFAAVTRNSLAHYILGISWERSVKWHRWVARWFVFITTCHAIMSLVRTPKRFGILAGDNIEIGYTWGLVAWIFEMLFVFFTFDFVRRRLWEAFYFTHMLAFATCFCACYHIFYLNLPPSVGFNSWTPVAIFLGSFLFYLIDIVFRIWTIAFKKGSLVSVKPEDFEVTRVEIRKNNFKFEGGQFVLVSFPQINPAEWHPFSISSKTGPDTFTLHVKDMGPGTFTNRLRTRASELNKVLVDGPYGKTSLDTKHYRDVVLVCGGVGVTPMISTLQEMHRQGFEHHDNVYFVWVARDPKAFNWFTDILNEVKDNPKVHLMLYSSTQGDMEIGTKLNVGRPNFGEIFSQVKSAANGVTAVLACGPQPMVDSVSDQCLKDPKMYHYHEETFFL